MTAGILDVAKRKPPGGAPDPTPAPVPKTTVKLAVDVHRKLRMIAGDWDLELSELLDQVLRPFADKHYKEIAKRIVEEDE